MASVEGRISSRGAVVKADDPLSPEVCPLLSPGHSLLTMATPTQTWGVIVWEFTRRRWARSTPLSIEVFSKDGELFYFFFYLCVDDPFNFLVGKTVQINDNK